MQTVDIRAAKAQLSRLVDEAAAGTEIVIARGGKPVAKLAPLTTPPRRKLGLLAGQLRIPADFDAPLPESVVESFAGR